MDAFFEYAFLQRAVGAGVCIAVACAVLGVFLLLRKDAMIGHGLSHIAFAGIALGLLIRQWPMAVSLAVAVVAALGIMKLKESAGFHGDTAIAVCSSLGMAVGVILASISGRFDASLLSYLFGDILAIEPAEVVLSALMALAVLVITAVFYHRFMFMTFDREAAQAAGVPVRRLDALMSVATAITVVLGMKIVGILLVAAFLVIPAAAGLQTAVRFKSAVGIAAVVASASVVVGLAAAYLLDWPASGTIVVVSFLIFGILFLFRRRA
ncbi:MAG: metal ABC transporter permease [Candidatus Aminicenantes bacterium]|nr:metal ABC transporter permease [Candidatus Aminicenantes bacterium]